ncbi:DNA-binding protein [Pseudomonas fragi]|uniref:Arc family DNA-binding protein n=1 Tax=Pseudomonas sp. WC2401 TaxID=3234143 RepID=UPI000D02D1F4|nr:DNA-binding protein [Pseudomonas fragi]
MRDSREQDKFVIRLPDGLRPEIAAVAYRNQRSMNGEIINRLERSLTLELALDEKRKIINQLLNRIAELEAKANE